MFFVYSFLFDIIIFLFYLEAVIRRCSFKRFFLKTSQNSQENIWTGVFFSSAASNLINKETAARYFPMPLSISAEYVRLGYKSASVLPPDLKPICKDFLLRKSVVKSPTVLYYHHNCSLQEALIRFTNWNSFFLLNKPWVWQMFFKIGVLKNFTIFTRKHLCWRLILVKLQPWFTVTLLKRDSNTAFS